MAWLFFLTAALFLVVVPGLALLSWFFREEELDPLERFCLATGLGLALQPITFYALFLLHLRGLETAPSSFPPWPFSLILRFSFSLSKFNRFKTFESKSHPRGFLFLWLYHCRPCGEQVSWA